ncbi:MotA/TolQ/ExbB proton channel family protein [bacterium]|nr:MotA/TolQ/ExbB proton channel family protein [candidate division CSSED10-310 bacterium]
MVTGFEQFALLQYFNKGGPMMWPLLAVSIIVIGMVIERIFHYYKVSINTPEFLKKIRTLLEAKRIKEAITLCENYKGPIASIMKAGLLKTGKSREEIETAIAASGGIEMSRLERGLTGLATCSSIAPLLGFLGTVTGMIKSFEAIAAHGMNNPALVAVGISEALITTAAGLMIGIPAMAFYNYFTAKVSKLVLEMEESSGLLLEYMEDLSTSAED